MFDEEWALALFVIGIGIFILMIIINILSSPLLLLILTYGFFLLFYFGLVLVSILVSRFLSLMFEDFILTIFNDVINIIFKTISVIGIVFSAYLFIKGLIVIELSDWGIKEFIQVMTVNPINKFSDGVTLFDPNVFSKFWFMIKALYINIGRHIFGFIWYFLLPWSIVSAGYGILSE